jgi:hypothetical protein
VAVDRVASLAGSGFVRDACNRYAGKLLIVHVAQTLCTEAGERRVAQVINRYPAPGAWPALDAARV